MIRIHRDRAVVGVGCALYIFQASSDAKQMKLLRCVEVPRSSVTPTSQNGASTGREISYVVDGCFSPSGEQFAVITSSKALVLFNTVDWTESVFGLPKTPTRVLFDRKGDVVLSDKAGSVRVYRQPLTHDEGPTPESSELLGHISMLLDFCFSIDGRLIFTADRDEKLRLSRYPQTFLIEAFCLGHSSFINTVVCLPDGESVATAGGDSSVRVWNVSDGKLLAVEENVCDGPIRKLLVGPSPSSNTDTSTLIVLPDKNEGRLPRLLLNNGSLSVETPIQYNGGSIYDTAVAQSGLVASLGQHGIWISSTSMDEVATTATLAGMDGQKLLDEFTDALAAHMEGRPRLTELSKARGFDNLKAYQELKEERLDKKKKKVPTL